MASAINEQVLNTFLAAHARLATAMKGISGQLGGKTPKVSQKDFQELIDSGADLLKESVKLAVLLGVKLEASEDKKTAAKKTTAKKATAAKTAAAKKTAAKKTTTTKKAAAKKAEIKTEMYLQFSGKEYSQEEILQKVKDIWTYDLHQNVDDIKDVQLYLKPEESAAYYVVNGVESGKVVL